MKYQLKHEFKFDGTKIDYQKELNAEQYEVLKNAAGPCLVLAGAGSGKTRTLVYLTAFLLEQGIQPQNLMLVTFTNKAAKEMLNRVELLLKYHPKGLWGGTFHHLANIVLRRYANLLGYQNNFTILDKDDSKDLIKNCLGEMNINTKQEYFPKPDLIAAIISFKQNSLLDFREIIDDKYDYLNKSHFPNLIPKIFDYYQNKKKKLNAMDFDDLLANWHKLLTENKSVAEKLAAQFKYILVDEYQDTNKIQADIVEKLAQAHKNIVVVGDDSQSIYSFRAATINNILDFPKKFPGTKIFKLETNYRSTPEILSLANNSIKNNLNQFKKELRSVKEKYSKPALVPLQDSYEQGEFVCQKILELQNEGASLRNIAVLFRAAYQALELELELNKRNIPYEMRGGIRFFEQAHIKDVIAYLKILANFKDELAWKRIAQLYPGIGPGNAQKIWEYVAGFSDFKNLKADANSFALKANNSFNEILKLLEKLQKIEADFTATAIGIILNSGYKKYMESVFENAADRFEDLEQLANFALGFKDLNSFLTELALSEAFKGETKKTTEKRDNDALILSTIHQAKGLEWKKVFLIGLTDGQFPHHKVYDRPQEMEEERRLFYVATTRAEDELYLTYPIISNSFKSGQFINRPSTFLKELNEDLFEKWDIENNQEDVPTIYYDDAEDDEDDDDPDDNPPTGSGRKRRLGIFKMIDRI